MRLYLFDSTRFFQIAIAAFLLIAPLTGSSQPSGIRIFNVHAGFYTGPVQYIGPYNPSVFGNPITYQTGDSDQDLQAVSETGLTGGDVSFGGWSQIRLTSNFYLRGKLEFGSLVFEDSGLNYQMRTPYRTLGAALKWLSFPRARLQPYLIAGIDRLRYTSPAPNPHALFADYSPNQLGEGKRALAFPVSAGFNIRLSQRSKLFSEAAFTYTNTNQIDNFTPPADLSDYSLGNDGMFSFRFGLSIELIRRSSLPIKQRELPPPGKSAFDPPSHIIETDFTAADLVPPDSLIASRHRAGIYDRPEEPAAMIDEEHASDEHFDFGEGEFDTQAERDFILQWLIRHREQTDEPVSELSRPAPISTAIPDDSGILDTSPPQGYYVQIYASLGESFARNAMQSAIEVLDELLDNPARHIFIYETGGIYRVRIGYYEEFIPTLSMLDVIQGTFVDAYILYYMPDDE